jgi:hypothetical protein
MSEPDTGWVSRFVVSLCEPLLDTAARVEIDDNMISLISSRPHWLAAWLSGFLSDIVRSLDPDDPWRNLTPQKDGKVLLPDGTPFGSWVDATDIVKASTSDLRSDLGLAALERPLHDEAAQLFAVAAQGWDPTLHWLESHLVTGPEISRDQAKAFFRIGVTALRWSLHRRRLFAGMEDPFVPVSGSAWILRADRMVSGEHWDEARAARHLLGHRVEPGSYRQFH